MRKSLAALAVFCISVAQVCAAPLVYEPFDYDPGERVLGQTNASTGTSWLLAASTATDTTAINVAGGNLSMPPGMPGAGGNSASLTGTGGFSGAANRLAFDSSSTTITSGTVYYSLALRIDALTGSNTGVGGFFIGLNNTGNFATAFNPSLVAARIQARIDPTDPTKYNLGIVRNRPASGDTGLNPIPWSGPLSVGDTNFLVASIEFVEGDFNDVARLWINPGNLGDATAPAATITDNTVAIGTAGADIGIASIILRQSPAPYLTLDEIRVGTEWADVTPIPEPASLGLLAVGATALLARRRAR